MRRSAPLIAALAAVAALSTAAALVTGAIGQGTNAEADAPPTVRARRIPVAPGVSLHVVERGDPNGTPVLLLHGLSDSWSSFSRFMDHLPSDLRLIAVDLRGHGASSKPTTGYGIPVLAHDVAVILDSLKLDRVVVVGHSMGSLVAQHLVAQRPNRASGLVLIGAARGGAHIPGMAEFRAAVAQFVNDEEPVSESFARDFQMSTLHVPVPAPFLDSAVAASLKLPARVWKALLQGFVTDSGPTSVPLVPTLVMWGDKDTIMPLDEQRLLVQRFGASFETFGATGHSTHWERPALAAQRVVGFMQDVAGARK